MKKTLKNEIPILVVVMLPFLYLGIIWNSLPDIVPTHWNIHGIADRYSRKESLIWIPFLLPFLTYLIFIFAPIIDAKKRLENMGNKLIKLKFALTFIMSILALFIIYFSGKQEFNRHIILIIIGTFLTILGNFFPTLKPNYFIGIRTPWTLRNENNWKETHRFGGKLWFISGISIIIINLFIQQDIITIYSFYTVIFISILPIIYSYYIYKKTYK